MTTRCDHPSETGEQTRRAEERSGEVRAGPEGFVSAETLKSSRFQNRGLGLETKSVSCLFAVIQIKLKGKGRQREGGQEGLTLSSSKPSPAQKRLSNEY